jgi:hypothetical protein
LPPCDHGQAILLVVPIESIYDTGTYSCIPNAKQGNPMGVICDPGKNKNNYNIFEGKELMDDLKS